MSNAQFIDVVRQYAAMARRKRLSFAAPVHQFAQERVNTIKEEQPDAKLRGKAIQDLQAFLNREYQPNDAEFVVKAYD